MLCSTYVVVAHENPNHDYIDIERGLNKKRHTYIQTLFAASLLEADWTRDHPYIMLHSRLICLGGVPVL